MISNILKNYYWHITPSGWLITMIALGDFADIINLQDRLRLPGAAARGAFPLVTRVAGCWRLTW